jgi:uncharacterized integral membrane protein
LILAQLEELTMSQGATGQSEREGSVWRGRLIAAGIVLGILALFVILNSEKVEVSLLVMSPEIRLGWALLLAGAIGISGSLAGPPLPEQAVADAGLRA